MASADHDVGLIGTSHVPQGGRITNIYVLAEWPGDSSEAGAEKLLEDCNIKLASVATDVLGVSGWDMLTAIANGESDPERLANMARRTLRKKIPQLIEALRGIISQN